VVGNFLWAQDDPGGKEIHVAVDLLESVRGKGKAGGAGGHQFSAFHQIDQGILKHLGIHGERRNIGGFSQDRHHGVADVADSGLERQEFFGDALSPHLAQEEVQDMVGDFATAPVTRSERLDAVGFIVFNDADDPAGIHHGVGHSDFGQGVVKGHGNAVGGRRKDENVRHFPQSLGMKVVDFDENVVGIFEIRRGRPHRGGEINPAVGGDFRGFHHREVELAVKTRQHGLGEL